jgi:hypothetical protein
MRAVLHRGERDVRVETVPEPVLGEPTDALGYAAMDERRATKALLRV